MTPNFKMGYHLTNMLSEQEEEKQDTDAAHKEGDKKNVNIEDEVKEHCSRCLFIFDVVNLIIRSSVDAHDEPDFDE